MKNDKDFLGTQPVGKLLLNLAHSYRYRTAY